MEELKTINTTLCLIKKNDEFLLGQKKRGFAKGTINGIGGKQDPGETIVEAMIRETQEEIGVTPTKFDQVGYIHFDMWYKGEHANMNLWIYTCDKFDGKVVETEEMIPIWFNKNNLPFDRMLEDDKLWWPYVLEGKKFVGDVKFNPNMEMLAEKFEIVKNFESDGNANPPQRQ